MGGGCGSGSVCGHWNGGSLVLTNAHVAGTRVGRQIALDFSIAGQTVTKSGRVIMAAYSDRTLADWAVVFIPDWQEVSPIKLSTTKPTGTHHTTGSPACVWPMRFSRLTTADVSDTSTLWRWRPNAIGGQSGSHVVSDADGVQYGLLTWSWGGLGAGQQTSEIYRQARDRSVAGEPRIAGMRELSPRSAVVENGFFAAANVADLPIWANPPGAGEGDETEPEVLSRLRRRARERDIDFVRLIQLILDILELFR